MELLGLGERGYLGGHMLFVRVFKRLGGKRGEVQPHVLWSSVDRGWARLKKKRGVNQLCGRGGGGSGQTKKKSAVSSDGGERF